MQMRRLTGLTNGSSKKWKNLWAFYCVHIAYYNFCRIHRRSWVTPAMEAGITDRVWSVEDLLSLVRSITWVAVPCFLITERTTTVARLD
jgi:hypothetical protein